MADWRRALLRSIGAPVTPQNLKFLSNWQRWEGGHTNNSARFNWLNTTRGTGQSINDVGVKRFSDFNTGIRYTAETLMNGRYDDIVKGLSSGNPYSYNVSAGLQTWVSGRPDGNPEYARKVLGQPSGGGGGGVPKVALTAEGAGRAGNPGLAPSPSFDLPDDFLWDIWGKLTPLFKQTFGKPKRAKQPAVDEHGHPTAFSTQYRGKTLVLPTQWKSTHPTDGLADQGFRSAIDIMGNAGTPVGAPEDGEIVRWGSAQGGSSIWFRGKSGRLYWIGHIDNIAPPGTRVRRGQVIARISADHPRPHVHLDVRR